MNFIIGKGRIERAITYVTAGGSFIILWMIFSSAMLSQVVQQPKPIYDHHQSTASIDNNNNNITVPVDVEYRDRDQQDQNRTATNGPDNSPVSALAATAVMMSKKSIDKRMEIKRPFMTTASQTFINSIYDIERKYEPNEACSAWGGSKFIENLNNTAMSLLTPPVDSGGSIMNQSSSSLSSSPSSILSFSNSETNIFLAENVSIVFDMPKPKDFVKDKDVPYINLEINGKFRNKEARARMVDRFRQGLRQAGPSRHTILTNMTTTVKEGINNLEDKCTTYIDYPVLLVDIDIDPWNWWFFLKVVLHHYITVAMVQPMIMGDYNQANLRVMFAFGDGSYSRSFIDAFEFLFSDRRGKDSRQFWNFVSDTENRDDDDNGNKKRRICFRKLLWSPGGSTSAEGILINRNHDKNHCFSSIVYSYAAFLKASMHIPVLPRPDNPRVVWVGRDPSPEANKSPWQSKRIVENQQEVIRYLRQECKNIGVELIVADFYGNKADTPFQEQVLFVSRANIMIGMHGAGLNMFHFMPFNSVVVEIHRGTTAQKNSANFVTHIKEGKYLQTNAQMNGKNLKKEPIWETLKTAINAWKTMGNPPVRQGGPPATTQSNQKVSLFAHK